MTQQHEGGDLERVERALESVNESRRSALRKMLMVAYVAPVVASFAIEGMVVGASAAAPNSTVS